LEDLESRRLLSLTSLHQADAPAVISPGGAFSHHDRVFRYITPTGGHATIRVVGLGHLTGTTLDSSGDLHLVYGGTNAFSKIVGSVQGGGGHAPLASILNRQLIDAGAANSLSGIGGNVLESVLMSDFNLIPGGTITLTAGVNSVNLNSIGANTQVNLRALPPAPTPTPTTPTSFVGIVSTPTPAGNTVSLQAAFGPSTSISSSSDTTLQARQSATVTTPYGTSNTYVSDSKGGQTLTAVTGSFTSAGNIQVALPAAQPPSIPPAPPGVILKVNRIAGDLPGPINLQTDSKLFGYDPVIGEVIRFNLNLANNTGAPDPSFTPIHVPGSPVVAGLSLGRVGSQLVVLVGSGTTVYAYNATTGAPLGSFTNPFPINSIASTDTATVLGSYETNQLRMINLAASLQTGTIQPAEGQPRPFTPQAGFTFLGGLTSAPGVNAVYATIAATFNSFQPTFTQLGVQTIRTSQAIAIPKDGTVLVNGLSSVSQTAVTQQGTFINVAPNPLVYQPGIALGSVDQRLALERSATNGVNVVSLASGSLVLSFPDPLVALSQNFRPDVTGSALIDIQGTLQSIRGRRAVGMVLNDTGNLNLVKFDSVANSTIVGQPINHLQINQRSNVSIVSSTRDVGRRNGVDVVSNLQPIGPLSRPND
jgi:hypothetical protein